MEASLMIIVDAHEEKSGVPSRLEALGVAVERVALPEANALDHAWSPYAFLPLGRKSRHMITASSRLSV